MSHQVRPALLRENWRSLCNAVTGQGDGQVIDEVSGEKERAPRYSEGPLACGFQKSPAEATCGRIGST
jgi:hypothetical protein